MPRTRMLIPSMLAALVLLAPSSAQAGARGAMVQKVNHYRSSHGVHGMRMSRSLSRSAARYARRMLRAGYFGHAGRIHVSRGFRRAGEVLAMHRGSRPLVAHTVNSWAHSPGHAGILLDRTFTWVGAGKATGYWHGRRWTFWVVHVGRR
jgi:uncharacterized protein YkwD